MSSFQQVKFDLIEKAIYYKKNIESITNKLIYYKYEIYFKFQCILSNCFTLNTVESWIKFNDSSNNCTTIVLQCTMYWNTMYWLYSNNIIMQTNYGAWMKYKNSINYFTN